MAGITPDNVLNTDPNSFLQSLLAFGGQGGQVPQNFGLSPTSGGFDMNTLSALGAGTDKSGGVTFNFKNPNTYTPWGESKGFGDYLGSNMGLFANGLNALVGLSGAVQGWQQLGLAKKAFGLEKKAYETNLRNQTQSYNTQVGDRIAGRWYASEAEREAALKEALLPTPEEKKKRG